MGRSLTPDRLLAGLDSIAATLAHRPQALALLALGSCGVETGRMDAFSDLDFFVIVEESAKAAFIDNLDWLTCGKPLVFAHRNTVDGWKTLDEDGVLCEFAVFHPAELAHIPFSAGRVVWAREGFDVSCLQPLFEREIDDLDWLSIEAMTNILVGLKRYLRGEKLSAWRCICVDAMEQVCLVLQASSGSDIFNPWRGLEVSNPAIAGQLQAAIIDNDPARVARGLVTILSQRSSVPKALLNEVIAYLDFCDAG
jgi:lincosamide nucleotidyltransferase B/F